jgi:hypothetical protein
VPIELLQSLDLMLQGGPLGFQASDNLVVLPLGFALESVGSCLGVFGYLFRRGSRIRYGLVRFLAGHVGPPHPGRVSRICRCRS